MPSLVRHRLAVRALIVLDGRLLLVNAYPGQSSDLWCAPGGGAQPHVSLPDNLIREVHEETGLTVAVGAVAMINEFHDPEKGFHQVDLFFRCGVIAGQLDPAWRDPEGVVNRHRLVTPADLTTLPHKPDGLADAAWGDGGVAYDPLELLLRP